MNKATAIRLRVLGVAAFIVTAVPSMHAQKVLTESVKDLASQIAASATKEQKRKIAVVPFRELDGRTTVLGTFIAEELATDLFSVGNFEIVERTMLEKVFAELKLNASGAIDPQTAKQLGKLAGVDAIVTGTITDLQSYVAVNCRMIDSQTGSVFAVAQARVVRDDDVKKIMGTALGSNPPSTQTSPPSNGLVSSGGTSQTPSSEPLPTLRKVAQGLTFELQACRRTNPRQGSSSPLGLNSVTSASRAFRPIIMRQNRNAIPAQRTPSDTSVTCSLFVTSENPNVGELSRLTISGLGREVLLGGRGGARSGGDASRAFDAAGNEYVAARVRLGNSEDAYQASNYMPKGEQVRAVLWFEDIPEQLSKFDALDIGARAVAFPFRVEIKNVPIVR